MAIEIVSFPIKNGWIFHSYVSLPEGSWSLVLGFLAFHIHWSPIVIGVHLQELPESWGDPVKSIHPKWQAYSRHIN